MMYAKKTAMNENVHSCFFTHSTIASRKAPSPQKDDSDTLQIRQVAYAVCLCYQSGQQMLDLLDSSHEDYFNTQSS